MDTHQHQCSPAIISNARLNQWRKAGCSKKELAMAYAPGMKYDTAKHRMQRWIKGCSPLMKELKSLGYNIKNRNLNPKEVKTIFKFLGTP